MTAESIRAARSPDQAGKPKLTVSALSLRFGGIVALDDLSFSVEEGTICA